LIFITHYQLIKYGNVACNGLTAIFKIFVVVASICVINQFYTGSRIDAVMQHYKIQVNGRYGETGTKQNQKFQTPEHIVKKLLEAITSATGDIKSYVVQICSFFGQETYSETRHLLRDCLYVSLSVRLSG